MSIRLNSSMPAFAMRHMNKAQDKVSVSMQRLASGRRINSAADDAAGLAIATGMTSQIQGYNQSIRNANDDISILQVAEGTLSEVTNVLQRMRELTVQAGNDSNSQSNRDAISQEIDMLSNNIKEMMDNTEFNGIPLFAANDKLFNVGIEGGSFALDIGGFNYRSLTLNSSGQSGELQSGRVSSNKISDQSININGVDLTAINGTTEEKVTQLNQQLNSIGITARGSNRVNATNGSGITDGKLTINGTQVARSGNIHELADNINRDIDGVSATVNARGQLQLSNNTGRDITVDNHGNESGTGLVSDNYRGVISLAENNGKNITVALNKNGVQADLDALGLTEVRADRSLLSQTVSGKSITDADKITINGYSLEINSPISSAFDIAAAFNKLSQQSGVTVSATTEVALSGPDFTQRPTTADAIQINGQQVDLSTCESVDDVISVINTQLKESGVAAGSNSEGKLLLTSKLGYDITIKQNSGDFLQTGPGTTTFHGKLNFQSEGLAIQIGSDIAGQSNKESVLAKIGLSDTSISAAATTSGINVSNAQAVAESLQTLDQALLNVANERSSYGAQQNRLEHTINQLSDMVVNTETSRSRILDTDYAAESAALAKNQLLMQTSGAMLVRFNKIHSEQILSLLNSLG
jgi:flagellin